MSLFVNIKKDYKNFSISVNFESSGEPLGLLGASGSGKSLTLKCIAGIETPDQGSIILNDRVLYDSELGINIPPRQRNIGLLFQNYALFPNMSVKENIGLGIRSKSKKNTIIEKMLSLFHLNELQHSYPWQLSGGEQQRTAMARLLAYEPDVLMLDEPFTALDTYLKDELYQELKDVIGGYDKDIIMVSHSKEELYRFCDSIAVLDHGQMMEFGNKTQIFHHPEQFITARLVGCNNISRATKISDYEVMATDWDLCLKTEQRVPENIQFIGIDENHILPVSDTRENTIEAVLSDFTEGPDEVNMIYRSLKLPVDHNRINVVLPKRVWTEQKGQVPNYLYFPKKYLLLLHKGRS